jgi:alpha,alpha-trehalose phosphorylase
VRWAPRLPAALARLAFTIRVRNRRLRVEIGRDTARYVLLEGPPLLVEHHDTTVLLTTDAPADLPVPAAAQGPRPRQPKGREPQG